MSAAFVSIAQVSKRFAPHLSLGDKLAAKLGGAVETRAVKAVTDVSLAIRRGETLGLVGESGCGKSTLGRLVAGITSPDAGVVELEGAPIRARGRKTTTRIQTVFQDPFASLDPRMRVGDTIAEGPLAHGLVPAGEGAKAFARRWLGTVGLEPDYVDRFPHQFSGGQRQRIAIARALAMKPDVLVCDEPVASLDVSIQAQIINLFLDLRRRLDLTMLFISHDLGVVRHLCDRVAVMYLGRIVEIGPTAELYGAPKHPYARALLEAVPKIEGGRAVFKPISGEIPSPLDPPPGCAFNPRCPLATDLCRAELPALRELAPDWRAACHYAR
ncbi:MAG: transporter ATP-binding protein [Enterovirga sp.]|nr:transporter ATP-binding protein [Enterovirga sp.]